MVSLCRGLVCLKSKKAMWCFSDICARYTKEANHQCRHWGLAKPTCDEVLLVSVDGRLYHDSGAF